MRNACKNLSKLLTSTPKPNQPKPNQLSNTMSPDPNQRLYRAHRLREEANEAFNQDDFSTSLKLYQNGLASLNQIDLAIAKRSIVNSMGYLRVTLHSNLAETYLRLGMGYMARNHCNRALAIDKNDPCVPIRLGHAQRMIQHHRSVADKVKGKMNSMEAAKKAKSFDEMVPLAMDLKQMIDTNGMDAHLTATCLVTAAEIEMILAKALLKESSPDTALNAKPFFFKAVAKIHFRECGKMYNEVSQLCAPYCSESGSFGFDGADVSFMAIESRWRANLFCAKAGLKRGQALLMIEMVDSSSNPFKYASTLKDFSIDGRSALYRRLAETRQFLSTGLEAIQHLHRNDKVQDFLKGRRLLLEVEILLELISIHWIGFEYGASKELVATIDRAVKSCTTSGVDKAAMVDLCNLVKEKHKTLIHPNSRNAFSISMRLLSTCLHAATIADNTEMQITLLRELIQTRRMQWITQSSPKYSPISEDDKKEDENSTVLLMAALRKNGREISDECPICYEPLIGSSSGGVVKPLKCGHFFHHRCCQQYYNCSGKVPESDKEKARAGRRIIKELPCPTCRTLHKMKVLKDGSLSEVY